jgi:RNA-directed DNA polymerase
MRGAPDGVRRVDRVREDTTTRREVPRQTGRRRTRELGLPPIGNVKALAKAMSLTGAELLHLADPRRFIASGERSSLHYRLLPRRKRGGGTRYLLAPKRRLKQAQRFVLREILDRIDPPTHAHGFVRGRSIVTHAQLHTGRAVVVRVDVADFFHRFTLRRVRGFFESLGYERDVGLYLACLCTAPVRQMADRLAREAGVDLREALPGLRGGPAGGLHPILPQGAPSSPALANLMCRRLDHRLHRLASRFGATYSRYADDLTFSGDEDLRRGLRRFLPLVRRIMRDEGLRPAPHKLAITRGGARQRVCGLVVNERVNVPSSEVRKLRAIIHNCVIHGPADQNRVGVADFRAHLRGRVEFVRAANPVKGQQLLEAFGRINWSCPDSASR